MHAVKEDVAKVVVTDKARSKAYRYLSAGGMRIAVKNNQWYEVADQEAYVVKAYTGRRIVALLVTVEEDTAVVVTQMGWDHHPPLR